jgi:amino acid transporter
MAMIFVLLTYGGWNEAAYLSGELREPSRSMSRVLLYGTLLVMALYLLANLAFLHVFGLDGLRQADAVGAELMRRVAGPPGEALLGGLICITALSTLNATILTGARVYYALGRDVPQLAMLGTWNDRGATPVRALLVQGAITLLLVLFGGARRGFPATLTAVGYTFGVFALLAIPGCGGLVAPIWWLVAVVIGLSEAQRCGTGRAAAAVLTPALLLCVCCCLGPLGMLLGGALGGLNDLGHGPAIDL